MFERYTEEARRAVFFARYEAGRFGSPTLETEHLLLGLIRADHTLIRRFLPHKLEPAIWMDLEAFAVPGASLAPSADMPLSEECRRALSHAAEEADQVRSGPIRTEHLLLGLLRERNCRAAQVLARYGLELEQAREAVASARHHVTPPMFDRRDDTVETHGELWDAAYVATARQYCRKFCWEKRLWAPRDALVERATRALFLYFGQPYDPEKFDVLKGGWTEDHCAICWWRLFHSPQPEHGAGYSNGQEWLCAECYERFIAPPTEKK